MMRIDFVYVIFFLAGFISGAIIIDHKLHKNTTVGKLRIDASDPNESPYLFLELKSDPNEVMKHNRVYLDVDSKPLLSREKQSR